jgi:hypothetical protein
MTHDIYATCMTCGHDLDEGQYLRITRDPEGRKRTCDTCGELNTDAQADRIEKGLKEKDRERDRRIVHTVVAAALAGGIATAWVPPIPRHGGNIEILRFGLRWLLAAAVLSVPLLAAVVLGVPAALSVPAVDRVFSGPRRRLHKLWVRYFVFDSTRTRSPWDSGWRFCVLVVAVNLTLWPLIIVMFAVVFGFVMGH